MYYPFKSIIFECYNIMERDELNISRMRMPFSIEDELNAWTHPPEPIPTKKFKNIAQLVRENTPLTNPRRHSLSSTNTHSHNPFSTTPFSTTPSVDQTKTD